MKHRIFRLTVLLLAVTLLAVACSAEAGDGTATVRFSISNERARTISAGENRTKISKYTFTLSGTADYTFDFDRDASGVYLIKGVAPGAYTVKVEALSSDGTKISEATAEHFFIRGENSFSITLSSLLGSQALKLTFLWKPSAYRTTPEFTLTLTSENGSAVTVNAGELTLDTAAGKAILQKTLPAGSYIVNAKLHSGNAVYIGYTEVVRMTNGGAALEAEVDFKSGGAVNNSGIITTNIDVPIEGTITASNDALGQIVADLTITSKPEGISDSDITITWYNEHYKLSSTTSHTEFYGMPGLTLITAIMTCSKTGAMGSATLYFNNEGN